MFPLTRTKTSRILNKVLFGTSVLVFASVVCLSTLFLLRHKSAFEEQLRLRAEVLATSLSGQVQFPLLVDNREELARIARLALAGDRDLVYVLVEDEAGQRLAGAERPLLQGSAVPPRESIAQPSSFRRVSAGPKGEPCIEVTVPVIPEPEGAVFGLQPSQTSTLGHVRLALSLRSQQALFQATLRHVGAVAAIILLLAGAASYFQIGKLLRPLVELSWSAKRIGGGHSHGAHIVRASDDEIGDLVDSFNQMADQVANRTRELTEQVQAKEAALLELATAQRRLIDLSRQAGRAEIATNVLHNVGNVLNSVNVSAGLLAGKVQESRVDKLTALSTILTQNAGSLDHFLAHDPKGQRVLPYLGKLGEHFRQERESMLKELELLNSHVGHIKRIVATQQSYARVSGLVEEILLAGLVDDAVRIIEPSLLRHDVILQRDFEQIPALVSDKHEILQILLNLLRNAIQAIQQNNKPERLIRVRLRLHNGDRVRIEVRDSGIGLRPGYETRIFAHGFTTKPDGHGFGLHSGALAARQLGGALWAESEVLGLGATFTLELPLTNAPATDQRENEDHGTANVRS
jgi:signal transduction histidine kinase